MAIDIQEGYNEIGDSVQKNQTYKKRREGGGERSGRRLILFLKY